MAELDLAPIKARIDKATEGPWINYDGTIWAEPDGWHGDTDIGGGSSGEGGGYQMMPHDAEFIAHAREDIPALVEAVEQLRANPDLALVTDEQLLEELRGRLAVSHSPFALETPSSRSPE